MKKNKIIFLVLILSFSLILITPVQTDIEYVSSQEHIQLSSRSEGLELERESIPQEIIIEEPPVYGWKEVMTYIGDYKLTGYWNGSCGKSPSHPQYGITSLGVPTQENVTCAAPSNIPLGTKLYIEGVGYRIVQDRGGAIKNKKLDIYSSTKKGCYAPEYNCIAQVYIVTEEWARITD